MKKKGDFLNRILRISKEASDRKLKERDYRIRTGIAGGYNRMVEAIEKQAKNGYYWASITVRHEYSVEIGLGIAEKLREEGFEAKVKDDHILNTVVEASWSMLGDKDEKKQ